MSGHENMLCQIREELDAQNRAFADALTAMGVTADDLRRCDLELNQATVDGFWSEVFDLPSLPPTHDLRVAALRA